MSQPGPTPLTAVALSAMDRDAFVAALAGIVEHTSWATERAWAARPFADRAALHAAIFTAIVQASAEEQLELLRQHPELAGRAAIANTLTAESTQEQDRAGLRNCSPEEYAQLTALNDAYGKRFGHPFIVAVTGMNRQQVMALFAQRLQNDPDTERMEALKQVGRIIGIRLDERVAGNA